MSRCLAHLTTLYDCHFLLTYDLNTPLGRRSSSKFTVLVAREINMKYDTSIRGQNWGRGGNKALCLQCVYSVTEWRVPQVKFFPTFRKGRDYPCAQK